MESEQVIRKRHSIAMSQTQLQEVIALNINRGKISKEHHVAHVFVPVGVAALLREYPTLLAVAVRSFCNRVSTDNKVLCVMRHFPPELRVLTSVRFSKSLYSQLMSDRYVADPRTGWGLPAPSNPKYRAHELGIKLACGFELLVCNAGGVIPATTPSTDTTSVFDKNDHNELMWTKYQQSLLAKGYYRGEEEGSKLYDELNSSAQQYFKTHNCKSEKEETDSLALGTVIVKLLTKVNTDMDYFRDRENNLPPADDDSWLKITCDDMYMGKASSEMTTSLSSFLTQISDVDGGEVTTELHRKMRSVSTCLPPNRKVSGTRMSSLMLEHPQIRKISNQSTASDVSSGSQMSSFSNKIEFNTDAFTDAMNNILDLGLSDDTYWAHSDGESSGLSSYGDDDEDLQLSRKSSDTSQKSHVSDASSGVDTECFPRQRDQNTSEKSSSRGDDFADADEFNPVRVDLVAVRELAQTYSSRKTKHSRTASGLFASLGLKHRGFK